MTYRLSIFRFFTLFICVLFCNLSFGASGIFQTYIVYNLDGTGNVFRAGGFNSDGAATYDGLNFGTPTSLILNGGEVKTFKNGLSDVFGAEISYRVYKQGSMTLPGFTTISLPFESNLPNAGDQRWQQTGSGVDILALATDGDGTYVLEVFWRADSSDGDHFDSAGGANYSGTFVISSLPVELSQFIAIPSNGKVDLKWQTKTEINNHYFEVERSIDARFWAKLGRVEGRGTTNLEQSYAYTDAQARNGLNYYRLKQVDFDGSTAYSQVITVDMQIKEGTIEIYPNPISTSIQVSWDASEQFGGAWLFVMGVDGRVVDQVRLALADGRKLINTEKWHSGWYIFNIKTDNGENITSQKVLKL